MSLTTISITCFLCPSKEGTKSMHGNILCEKIIVIYNVHTLPYKNTQKYFWKAEQVNERKWHNIFSVVCPKSPRFTVLKFINQWKFELNWGRDKEVTAFWSLAITLRAIFKMTTSCEQLSIMFWTWNSLFFHFWPRWFPVLKSRYGKQGCIPRWHYYEVRPWQQMNQKKNNKKLWTKLWTKWLNECTVFQCDYRPLVFARF